MTCSLCGKKLNPLSYFQIKIKMVSKIKVLDQDVKHKSIISDQRVCSSCRTEVEAFMVDRILKAPAKCNQCDGKCADCQEVEDAR